MPASMKVVFIALIASFGVGCVTQSAAAHDGAFTFAMENDTFTGSDNNYTNGVGATWVSSVLGTTTTKRAMFHSPLEFCLRWRQYVALDPPIARRGISAGVGLGAPGGLASMRTEAGDGRRQRD